MKTQSLKNRLKRVRAFRGQTMVLFALFLPVLIGMLGLAVDAAYLFSERRDIQGAADLAALAGASQLPGDMGAASSIASDIAADNGFESGVTVNAPFGGNDSQIEVMISDEVDLFFMPVLGLSSVTVSARSVASHEINAGTAVLAKKDYHCWEGTVSMTGSNITVEGRVHSNGAITLSGNSNSVSNKITYKTGLPVYPHDGWTDCGPDNRITGSNPNVQISSAQWQDWPVLYSNADFPCTFSLGSSNGNLERNGPWWVGGTMLPLRRLNDGVICFHGSDWMTMNEDAITGNVTFRAEKIDIRGSNTEFTAYSNGVLFFSDGMSFPTMRLYPSGGEWEGMVYNRHGNPSDTVEGGQIYFSGSSGFQHTGTIIGWAVTLAGNNWSLFGSLEATYEPMRLVE